MNPAQIDQFWEGALDMVHISYLRIANDVAWLYCEDCGALIMSSERTNRLCCDRGAWKIDDASWPPMTDEFSDIVSRHRERLLSQACFVNDALSTARLCVDSAFSRTPGREAMHGWHFGGSGAAASQGGFGSNLLLGGRVYTRLDPAAFYATISADNDAISRNTDNTAAVAEFAQYLRLRNPFWTPPPVTQVAVQLELHPDERPTANTEMAAIGRISSVTTAVPPVEARKYSAYIASSGTIPQQARPEDNYEPLVYPLFLPLGRGGFHKDQSNPVISTENRQFRTVLQFYKRLFYQRLGDLSRLPRLSERLALDAYSRSQEIAINALQHVKNVTDSRNLRQANRRELDAAQNMASFSAVGRKWDIPASIPGSPYEQRQKIADGMAVVSKFGQPSLFVTATFNPSWDEVKKCVEKLGLPPTEKAEMHPIITVRVFRAKLRLLRKLFFDKATFGDDIAYWQRVIEWQKRGFSHAHIMLRFLNDQPLDRERVDRLVSARLFISELCPHGDERAECNCIAHELMSIVKKCMLHECRPDRCGGPLRCKKHFPKIITETSHLSENGRWNYRRGPSDTHVVPYNPLLLLIFRQHLNVECCTGSACAAYIRAYQNKPPDSVRMRFEQIGGQPTLQQELREWQKARYLSSSEAVTRLLDIDVHEMEPSVFRVRIHLPGESRVVFQPDNPASVEAAHFKQSHLEMYFDRGAMGANLKFREFWEYHIATSKGKISARVEPVVCRIMQIPPKDIELYCLRLLLDTFPATAFDELKFGKPSFKQAAVEKGIYDDDNEREYALRDLINPDARPSDWESAPENVTSTVTAERVQYFFALLIANCDGDSNQALFDKYWRFLLRPEFLTTGTPELAIGFLAPFFKKMKLRAEDVKISYFQDEPQETDQAPNQDELDLWHILAPEQLSVAQDFVNTVHLGAQALTMIKAKAGTGKTTTTKAIIARLRCLGKRVQCTSLMASTASLLAGETHHRLFKIPAKPLEEMDGSKVQCAVAPSSVHGKFLSKIDVFVFDEIAMTDRVYFEAIEACLRDVCSSPVPFGGKSILILGDFRQLTPVRPAADRATASDSSVASSFLWKLFKIEILTRQHRQNGDDDPEFVSFLDRLGDGISPEGELHDGPFKFALPPTVESTCAPGEIYKWLSEEDPTTSIMIAYVNEDVDAHNDVLFAQHRQDRPLTALRGISKPAKSQPDDQALSMATPEFVEAASVRGVPPHILRVFPLCILQLLRNLDPSTGLSNGVRVQVMNWTIRTMTVKIIDDAGFKGKVATIPRIKVQAVSGSVSFERRQFPVRLGYCMTVNRSQGRTFTGRVAIDCRRPAFSHGQAYVAFSRVRKSNQLLVLTDDRDCNFSLIYRNICDTNVPAATQNEPHIDRDDDDDDDDANDAADPAAVYDIDVADTEADLPTAASAAPHSFRRPRE
jgi:hypothetical protein